MTRPTAGSVHQDHLIRELRHRIDAARFALGPAVTAATRNLAESIDRDVDQMTKDRVLHNLGKERRQWLRQLGPWLGAHGYHHLIDVVRRMSL